MYETLTNDHMTITINHKLKQINCQDKDDAYNFPCFYTTKKRPVEKIWVAVKESFNDNVTFNQMARLVSDNCPIHQWCSMD